MAVIKGRQVSENIEGIRYDHVKRYVLASNVFAGKTVIDAACGVGYGSRILASKNCVVKAYDIDQEALDYLAQYYADPMIEANLTDIQNATFPSAYGAVSFETIEHLPDPVSFLTKLKMGTNLLFGSVPNQDVMPFDKERHQYHVRHYTRNQLDYLLLSSGWKLGNVWGQKGKDGDKATIKDDLTDAVTLIFTATANGATFPNVKLEV